MTDTPSNRRFRSLLRLPSFGVALAASLAVLVAFAAWMFVDASFVSTLVFVRIDLGIWENPGIDLWQVHDWQHLGPRLLLFASLVVIGAVATVVVFYRILFGSRQGRSLRALFTAVALVALWLTLVLSHEKLEAAGRQWRICRVVKWLKQDAQLLSAQWPTADGVLPYCGQYSAYDNSLSIDPPESLRFFTTEAVEGITRRENGALMFDFGFGKGQIEYHPAGSEPHSFTEKSRGELGQGVETPYELNYFIKLEPNWYFVTYLPDDVEDAGKGPPQ